MMQNVAAERRRDRHCLIMIERGRCYCIGGGADLCRSMYDDRECGVFDLDRHGRFELFCFLVSLSVVGRGSSFFTRVCTMPFDQEITT